MCLQQSQQEMDKLKQLMQKAKPTAKVTSQKALIEEENKRYQVVKDEERKREAEQREKKNKQLQDFYEYDSKRKKVKLNTQGSDQPICSPEQVKLRLRALHQPITLFAQTQVQRYQRLSKLQAFYAKNPNFDMKTYDEQFQQKLRELQEFKQLDVKYRQRLIEPRLGDDLQYLARKKEMIAKEEQSIPYENMCDEVMLWTHKILRDWSQTLELKYNSEQLREKHKESWLRYEQSVLDMKSFCAVLKWRGGDKDMIRSIYHIVNCCLVREYIQANDKYIDLSIGNAPWPLGIAMLSITVKRNAPKVSHVLNDQLCRRWMQTIKRLISISQEMYPSPDDYKKVGYSVRSSI